MTSPRLGFVRTLLDLLLPRSCEGCGALAGPLCRPCLAALPVGLDAAPVVGRDGAWLPCASGLPYDETAKRLLLAYKEAGRHELADVLGELLAHAVLGAALLAGAPRGSPLVLVPVPARARSRRSRGADTGLLLAHRAAAVLRTHGVPVLVRPLLSHAARSRDQVGLARDARRRNVTGTLVARSRRVAPAPSGRPVAGTGAPDGLVVLTDDIVTTGATLAEAARALRLAGLAPAAAATVARTAPSHAPPGAKARPPLSPTGRGV